MSKRVELLAPAGDFNRLRFAFLYGADACYIGGKDYSLRANATNFSVDEIKEACTYAHSINKKIYLTVNILFHEEEVVGIRNYFTSLKTCNLDGIIFADVMLIPLIKEILPGVELHLSTQASTCNVEAVKYFKSLGVDRVVLAREVPRDDIKKIYKETGMDLEVFIHGAMCTFYSGRCVLSNYLTNRDSNRGGCSQVCRFCFDLDRPRKVDFSMATKDLNMAINITDMIDIGVTSFKIEGRMRSVYYLATVIRCYRKLIDAYLDGSYSKKLLKKELEVLNNVANRESSTQFYDHKTSYKDQYYVGRDEYSNQDFLGLVIDYDTKNKMVVLEERNHFKVGDKAVIFGPGIDDIEIDIEEIYNQDMKKIDCARHPREIIKLKVGTFIPKGSMIRVNK